MDYPTLEQVEAADRLQLARWYRFLPAPGIGAVERDDFDVVLHREGRVMSRIILRLQDAGGMTPEVSKAIGWNEGKSA